MSNRVVYSFGSRKFNLKRSRNDALTGPAEAETNNYVSRLNELAAGNGNKHWCYDFALNVLLPLWILFALATLGLIIAHGAVNPEWECYDNEFWYQYDGPTRARYEINGQAGSVYPRNDYATITDCLVSRGRIKRRLRIALWVIGFTTLGLGLLILLMMILFKALADRFWETVSWETAAFRNRMVPLGYNVHQTFPGCCGSNAWRTSILPSTQVASNYEAHTYAPAPSHEIVQINTGNTLNSQADKRAFVSGQQTVTTTTYTVPN